MQRTPSANNGIVLMTKLHMPRDLSSRYLYDRTNEEQMYLYLKLELQI